MVRVGSASTCHGERRPLADDLFRFLSILLLWGIPACSAGLYWAKPGAEKGEFERDLRSCRETILNEVEYSEMSLNPLSRGITDDALAQCLNSKGWYLAEKP